MIGKRVAHIAIIMAISTILFFGERVVIADDTTMIPLDRKAIDGWFKANVKPHTERKGTIDPLLTEAEGQAMTIKVRKDGSGDFKTLNEAIASVPSGNKKRVIISIGAGNYEEKIKIDRSKPFITLLGEANAMPNLTFNGTAKEYGTVDSATLIAESDYFIAANIFFVNSAPRPDGKRVGAQAVAMRISGTKAAFYNCKFIGFQDTLCDDKGQHFFKDCYVEGTVDFIFGSGKSLYLGTDLHVIGGEGMTVITAHARETNEEDTGYSFVHCKIGGTANGTYLGRAWKTSPKVVYAYTEMDQVVHTDGWSDDKKADRQGTVYYAEYKCSGPGAHPDGRVKYFKQLSEAEARPFLTLDYIEGSKWLLPPPAV